QVALFRSRARLPREHREIQQGHRLVREGLLGGVKRVDSLTDQFTARLALRVRTSERGGMIEGRSSASEKNFAVIGMLIAQAQQGSSQSKVSLLSSSIKSSAPQAGASKQRRFISPRTPKFSAILVSFRRSAYSSDGRPASMTTRSPSEFLATCSSICPRSRWIAWFRLPRKRTSISRGRSIRRWMCVRCEYMG